MGILTITLSITLILTGINVILFYHNYQWTYYIENFIRSEFESYAEDMKNILKSIEKKEKS